MPRAGIGPAAHLEALGIGSVADLPGVGDNLRDHPTVRATYRSAVALPGSTAVSRPRRGAADRPRPLARRP